ncbi:MAG: DNA replication/repair protein RecF [Lachnospiraceae bacterium]|nr:DNA replication/repair protein RecF [Lachnospiraceae bacterium]
MKVKKIELSNYRNYESLLLEPDGDTNILYGDNAQGKTNILESIYLCSTGKSHRGNKDKEIIRFGEDEAHIKMFVEKKEKNFRIDMHLKKNRAKGIAVNGIPVKKVSELFGIVNVVFFSPEDLSIIKNGPAERRRFIDLELCQLDKLYVYNLTNYSKVLLQRNKLLKDSYYSQDINDMLDIWDMQLAEYGSKLIERRRKFVNEINEIIKPIHRKLTDFKENIEIKYNYNVSEEAFYDVLKQNRERDIRTKTTNSGPHRDDISFYNGDVDMRVYGSQGQQRTAALSLKLAEIELVKKIINDTPILLLDDVLSELDSNRQNHLLSSLNDIQTVITCTGLDEFIENRFKINKVFKVTDGTIESKTV